MCRSALLKNPLRPMVRKALDELKTKDEKLSYRAFNP